MSVYECDMSPENSVALIIPQLDSHDEKSIENTIEPFAIFHNNGAQASQTFIKTFEHGCIQSLPKIDISFTSVATGELFDFQNRDHVLSLTFTQRSVRSA
jgi:hypothetical protein